MIKLLGIKCCWEIRPSVSSTEALCITFVSLDQEIQDSSTQIAPWGMGQVVSSFDLVLFHPGCIRNKELQVSHLSWAAWLVPYILLIRQCPSGICSDHHSGSWTCVISSPLSHIKILAVFLSEKFAMKLADRTLDTFFKLLLVVPTHRHTVTARTHTHVLWNHRNTVANFLVSMRWCSH